MSHQAKLTFIITVALFNSQQSKAFNGCCTSLQDLACHINISLRMFLWESGWWWASVDAILIVEMFCVTQQRHWCTQFLAFVCEAAFSLGFPFWYDRIQSELCILKCLCHFNFCNGWEQMQLFVVVDVIISNNWPTFPALNVSQHASLNMPLCYQNSLKKALNICFQILNGWV